MRAPKSTRTWRLSVAIGLAAVFALTPLTVVSASATTTATVSGTVLGDVSGGNPAPMPNAAITLYPTHDNQNALVGGGTDPSGHFVIPYVPVGSYRVAFGNTGYGPTNANVWLGNTVYESESTILIVDSNGVTGLTATMPIGATISGTISYTADVAASEKTGAVAAFLYNKTSKQFEFHAGAGAIAAADGTFTMSSVDPGDYLLRYGDSTDQALTSTVYWQDKDLIANATLVHVAPGQSLTGQDATLGAGGVYISRLSGTDRFATAVKIAEPFEPAPTASGPAVFIVNGFNYPDALSAGPAAVEVGGPLLLVTPTSVPSVVATELQKLRPLRIFIIGGPASVSSAVEQELSQVAPTERIGGTDRYETSRLVAKKFWPSGSKIAFLATGTNYPDALAAGPAAAVASGPVVLVNGSAGTVDDATLQLLSDIKVTGVTLTGGVAAISAAFEESLNTVPALTDVHRSSGADRYATAIDINDNAFRMADAVFLATGTGFPDALAGSALAGAYNAPIFLVHQDCVPAEVLQRIGKLKPRDIFLLGGDATLSPNVENLQSC